MVQRLSKLWLPKSGFWSGSLFSLLAYGAIFLLVFASKLILVHRYALPHPFWDAWHVEGEWLYKPFLTKSLTWADLLRPVSEHRPLVFRAYTLTLLSLNGQWDVALQMTVNGALFALFGCILWRLLSKGFDRLSSLILVGVIAWFLVLPSGWENTLNGHHVAWFFLYILSLLSMWVALAHRPFSPLWFLCLPLFVADFFSLLSGVLAPLAAAAALVLGMVHGRHVDRRASLAVVLLATLSAIGIAFEPHFPGQAVDQAQSAGAFLRALGYALVWPHWEVSWHIVALHAPMVIAIGCLLFGKMNWDAPTALVVALGAWTYLEAAAMAYARGVNGVPPVVRYMDILTIGLIANFALLVMARLKSKPWRGVVAALALVWMWSTWTGMEKRTAYQYAVMLPAKRKASDVEESNLRGYAATARFSLLANKPPDELAYYGGPAKVAALLNDPVLRTIYPASIRPPLAVEWAASKVFQDRGYAAYTPATEDIAVFGSYNPSGNWGKGSIESGVVMPARLPFLEFRVTGDLGRPGFVLKLVGQSGRTTFVAPPTPSLTAWTAVRVPSPREPFRIIADDESEQGWFAFCQPREMGRLSFYAAWLLEHGPGFLVAGKTVMFLLVLHQLWQLLVMWRQRGDKKVEERSNLPTGRRA